MRIIIVGAGAVGSYLAQRLSAEGQDVIVIEDDESRAGLLQDSIDALVMVGNGAAQGTLEQAGAENAEPDDVDELAQDRGQVDLLLRDGGADEAGVVGGVGEPGDAPADADGGHHGAHGRDPLGAFQDVAGRARVGPVDLHAEPGDH